jgi:hypothetical protein
MDKRICFFLYFWPFLHFLTIAKNILNKHLPKKPQKRLVNMQKSPKVEATFGLFVPFI